MLSEKSKRYIKSLSKQKNLYFCLSLIFVVVAFTVPIYLMNKMNKSIAKYESKIIKLGAVSTTTDLEKNLQKMFLKETAFNIAFVEAVFSVLFNFFCLTGIAFSFFFMSARITIKTWERILKEFDIDITEKIK